jgi:hypothetical protein
MGKRALRNTRKARKGETTLLCGTIPRQPAFAESYGGHEMPLPQEKTQLQWKPDFGVAFHQLEHERFANQAL